jgi:hypothetical protein
MDMSLTVWTDASWCGNNDRSSTGGSLYYRGEHLIHWKCSTCKSICLSSFEAEIVFMSKACQLGKAIIALCQIFDEVLLPVLLKCDNQGAIATAINNKVTSRTKHIHIRDLFVAQAIAEGFFQTEYTVA